jgi:uncharacterized protein (DUF1800 family)
LSLLKTFQQKEGGKGMKKSFSRLIWQISSACFVIALLVVPAALAQEDPNPDSPSPVLVSHPDSTRALAISADSWRGVLPKPSKRAFDYGANSHVRLFVTNIELMDGEGANAFRAYIQDARGREFRLPVTDLQPVRRTPWIYAVTVRLNDESGYWAEGPTRGDVLIRLSWRGLRSNRVRLSLTGASDSTAAKISDEEGAVPTPAPLSPPAPAAAGSGPTPEYVGYRWSGDRARFLEQATFGPTQALDDRIRRIGLRTWLAEQFEMPYPSANNPYPEIPLRPTTAPATCDNNSSTPDDPPTCFRDTYTMYPIQTWFYREALYGEPQLRHRVAWALSQIWVVSGVDTQQSSWMIAYHKVLSRNAFGNWRTLMQEMTLNPGMGNYLDMRVSTRTNPNENYAREVLQLFNVGLFMLNQDGTLQLDGQGNPIPTYDQETVNNFTKVLTGWQLCEVTGPQCPNRTVGAPNYKDPMIVSNANNHDITAKTLLDYPGVTNRSVAACSGCTGTATITYANNSLNQALDNIYNHPNVAPFVSKLLIQHLVTSDPSPAYVGRVAAVFNANRANPSQMKEVVKAILLDPEARGNAKTEPNYGKLREPVQLMTNILRHFNVAGAGANPQSDGNINSYAANLAQNAFNSPTVFNYYPPDYVVPGTTVLGPEFGIYTTGTAIGRANLMNTFLFGTIRNVALPDSPFGTSINLSEWQALAAADPTGHQLLDALNRKLMHGTMSAQMKETIRTAVTAVAANDPLRRARTAIYLIATSSQYQVQR